MHANPEVPELTNIFINTIILHTLLSKFCKENRNAKGLENIKILAFPVQSSVAAFTGELIDLKFSSCGPVPMVTVEKRQAGERLGDGNTTGQINLINTAEQHQLH